MNDSQRSYASFRDTKILVRDDLTPISLASCIQNVEKFLLCEIQPMRFKMNLLGRDLRSLEHSKWQYHEVYIRSARVSHFSENKQKE
jgi:hypothetical protein